MFVFGSVLGVWVLVLLLGVPRLDLRGVLVGVFWGLGWLLYELCICGGLVFRCFVLLWGIWLVCGCGAVVDFVLGGGCLWVGLSLVEFVEW